MRDRVGNTLRCRRPDATRGRDAEHLQTRLFRLMTQPVMGIPIVVMRFMVQAPGLRRGQQKKPAGFQGACNLRHQQGWFGYVLEHLVADYRVETVVDEGESLAIAGHVHVCMGLDVEPDVARDIREHFAVWTAATPKIQKTALHVLRTLLDRIMQQPPCEMKRIGPSQNPRSSRKTPDTGRNFTRNAQIASH